MMKRRNFITAGLLGITGAAYGISTRSQAASKIATPLPARPKITPPPGPSTLIDRAKAAMATHVSSLLHTDRIGIADYSLHSAKERFHIVDLTNGTYIGKHGTSRRLKGLDPSNNMAEPRAIVIHGAWYAEPEMVTSHGKLGRSQGCFAFSESDLPVILERLGPGRLLYADKV